MSVKINDYSITAVINNILGLLRTKQIFTELVFQDDIINAIIKPIDTSYIKYKYEYNNSKISSKTLIILLNFNFGEEPTVEIDLSEFFYTNGSKNSILQDDKIYYNFNLLLIKEAMFDISGNPEILQYIKNPKDKNQKFSYITKTYNNVDDTVKLTSSYYNENSKDIKLAELGIIYPLTGKYIGSNYNDINSTPQIYIQFLEFIFFGGQFLKVIRKLSKEDNVDLSYINSKISEQTIINDKTKNYISDVMASMNRVGGSSLHIEDNKKKNVRSMVNDVINDIINSFLNNTKLNNNSYNIDDNIATLKNLDNTYLNWTLEINNIGSLNITFKIDDDNMLNNSIIVDITNIKNLQYFKYYMYVDNINITMFKMKIDSLLHKTALLLNNTIKNQKITIPATKATEVNTIVNLDYTTDNESNVIIIVSSTSNIDNQIVKYDLGKYYITQQTFMPSVEKSDKLNKFIKYIFQNNEYEIVTFKNDSISHVKQKYFEDATMSTDKDTPLNEITKYFVITTNNPSKMVLENSEIMSNKKVDLYIKGAQIHLDETGKILSLDAPKNGKISMSGDSKIVTIEFNTKNGEGFGNNNDNIIFNLNKINILYVVIFLLLIYLLYRLFKKN